ncbi:MAG: peptidase M16 [Candidatus Parcubacteria bacterium]|nr:MAG: peptidase M16 [Candidatus Parcubacteria bacterium]
MSFKVFQGIKGLKILVNHMNDALSTSFIILVKVGVDNEIKKNNGISHFIEHLYFKGTKNFPNPKSLLEEIDKMGGIYNAFTTYQYTGFYIKVLPQFSEKAIFLLNDILVNSLFDKEEIDKERQVIFEEINMYNDDPAQLVVDFGYRLSFGDQPAGWPILGSKDSLQNITRNDIIDYVKNNYSFKNTFIIISGKILNLDRLLKIINENFKNYNNKKTKTIITFKNPLVKYQESVTLKKVDQAHIFMSWPLPGLQRLHDKRYLFSLLALIVGGKSSSRLWLKVREELGAAYYLRSYFTGYSNRSLFAIHAGIALDKLTYVLENIVKEINNLKKFNITESECLLAKTVVESDLFLRLEDSFSSGLFYGRQLLEEGKVLKPAEIIKKIKTISVKDIKKIINNLFTYKNLKFTAILPEAYKNYSFSKIFKKLV